MRDLVESNAGASSAAVRGAAATALIVGAALCSSFCYADDITYGYDALGRLTSVTVAGVTAYYDYDAAGNITAIQRQGALTSRVPVSGAASSRTSEVGKSPVSPSPTQVSVR
ncbi:RHS repeat domain-containing protein [Paraburkholderia lacunae]|uniref:RHS repeat domain-containing protein n=1 Tax=Paraburkholderia lacunae TaxID=2211104 RepID=UPI001FCA6E4F|nr:RHS repeat domain-containing protein [Paraburkholderia lacunae]